MSTTRRLKRNARRARKPITTKAKPGNRLRVTSAVLLFAFKEGLGLMGYTNPSLGWMIWGAAVVLLWWSICTSDWSNTIVMKIAHSGRCRLAGFIVILVSFGVAAWIAPWHKESEKAAVSSMVDDIVRRVGEQTNQQLEDKLKVALSQTRDDKEDLLKKEYPLGYVMVAFSGEKKDVLLCTDRFEIDLSRVAVRKGSINTVLVDIPRIYDKVQKTTCSISSYEFPAIPGRQPWLIQTTSLRLRIECLKADPWGIFVVLGFAMPASEKTQNS